MMTVACADCGKKHKVNATLRPLVCVKCRARLPEYPYAGPQRCAECGLDGEVGTFLVTDGVRRHTACTPRAIPEDPDEDAE